MKKPQAVLTGLAALTLFDLVGAPAPAQAQSPQIWAGYYVGAHAGYRWGEATGQVPVPHGGDNFNFFDSAAFSTRPKSAVVGFHLGYNYVSGNWLLGGETAWSWGRGTSNFGVGFSDPFFDSFATLNYHLQLTWSGSVRARFGYVNNDWLFYGTAGFAFQHAKLSGTGQAGLNFSDDFNFSASGHLSQSKVLFGYIVGAGIERQIFGGWTWRVEYLFADYARQNFEGQFNATGVFGGDSFSTSGGQSASVKVQTHTVRVGITKLFQP
jgi:outer membrane immunogenic protein